LPQQLVDRCQANVLFISNTDRMIYRAFACDAASSRGNVQIRVVGLVEVFDKPRISQNREKTDSRFVLPQPTPRGTNVCLASGASWITVHFKSADCATSDDLIATIHGK
jgi:hypothetical protein